MPDSDFCVPSLGAQTPRLQAGPFWIVERARETAERKSRKRTARRDWSEEKKTRSD